MRFVEYGVWFLIKISSFFVVRKSVRTENNIADGNTVQYIVLVMGMILL